MESCAHYEVLEQMDEITTFCSKMDYLAARAGYMKLTLGQLAVDKSSRVL